MTSSPPSDFVGGSTIGGANSKKYSDILSLDYCTFRIPYEELNVRFRQGQKDLDKAAASVAKAATMLSKKTAGSNEPVSQEVLRKNFDFLMKQVIEARETLQNVLDCEEEQIDKILLRCDKLHEEFDLDEESHPRDMDKMERQKFCRYVAWHLLRCGFVDAAKKLVKEMNLEGLIDVDIFEKMYEIEQSLFERRTELCIAWCERHRNKLRRIGSRMEIVARQQEVVTLIEAGNIPDAVAYVKKHIAPIAKAKFSDDLKKTMGAIACTLEQSRVRNAELHAEDRYEKCAAYFVKEMHRVYEVYGEPALSTLVQYGLATQKTPSCHSDTKTPLDKQKCIVCRPDVWPIAEELPISHVSNSRIFCSLTGTVCNDDDNIPYLFPSGHVFGALAIEKLKRPEKKIYDPVHKKLMDETEALRLYFL